MNKIDFSPIVFLDKNKEAVQREAYDYWIMSQYKGILEIATGVGKTFIGLMAIQQNFSAKKIIIAVPKIDLQEQWRKELISVLKIPEENIGRIGGGFQELDKPIVITVINSIRDKFLAADLLIMDEIHRYGSKENFKFLKNGMFDKILGLTATLKREDYNHTFLLQHAPLIYTFNQKQAIDNKILSEFELINSSIELTELERTRYDETEYYIKSNFKYFDFDFNYVKRGIFSTDATINHIAKKLMYCFQKRKQIVCDAQNKIAKTIELVEKNRNNKILIFCEYINTAEQITNLLNQKNIKSAKYHSKLKKKDKEEMLESFKNNIYRVMVAVKSLDEGTNIPDCDMEIIVAGTSVKRQIVQRLGRVLRISPDKEMAKIFHLYVSDTQDNKWMQKRLAIIGGNAKNIRWD